MEKPDVGKARGQEGIDRSAPYEIIQHLREMAP